MKILNNAIELSELFQLERISYFEDMVKCVVDIQQELIAVNAELHSDLVTMLLENGSAQKYLYGINIYDDGELEYDSLINPPRNREAGFPRAGRDVADPLAREAIRKVVSKWIKL